MQIGHIMAFLVKKGRKRVMSQINEEIFLTSILAEFLINQKYRMEVVAMLFTYPTNCPMLRFNTNRPLYGLPYKKGSKTSNVLN
jgi:hypothetical protein